MKSHLLQSIRKLPSLDMKHLTVWSTCSSGRVGRWWEEKSKLVDEEVEKALAHLLLPTGWPRSGLKGTKPNLEPHAWDGYVNKAGYSVLHQQNVAIALMSIGKS